MLPLQVKQVDSLPSAELEIQLSKGEIKPCYQNLEARSFLRQVSQAQQSEACARLLHLPRRLLWYRRQRKEESTLKVESNEQKNSIQACT